MRVWPDWRLPSGYLSFGPLVEPGRGGRRGAPPCVKNGYGDGALPPAAPKEGFKDLPGLDTCIAMTRCLWGPLPPQGRTARGREMTPPPAGRYKARGISLPAFHRLPQRSGFQALPGRYPGKHRSILPAPTTRRYLIRLL